MRYRLGHALWHPQGGGVSRWNMRKTPKKRPQCSVTLAAKAWVVLSAASVLVYHISVGLKVMQHMGHLFILRGTSIGTSPCGTRGGGGWVCYSNWNVLPRLTRASIMFLWRVGRTSYQPRNFASCAPRYIQLRGIHPNHLLYLIFDILRQKNVWPMFTQYT